MISEGDGILLVIGVAATLVDGEDAPAGHHVAHRRTDRERDGINGRLHRQLQRQQQFWRERRGVEQ